MSTELTKGSYIKMELLIIYLKKYLKHKILAVNNFVDNYVNKPVNNFLLTIFIFY